VPGYEPSELPFTDEELYLGWLLEDAGRRAPAGCGKCGATGRRWRWFKCRVCKGLGLVMIER
jgi:hypothetical protein